VGTQGLRLHGAVERRLAESGESFLEKLRGG
jgi:hypothetical protein